MRLSPLKLSMLAIEDGAELTEGCVLVLGCCLLAERVAVGMLCCVLGHGRLENRAADAHS